MVGNCPCNRYQCPDHINPAEFLADLISIDYSSADSVYTSQKRIDGLVESFSQRQSAVIYATPITINDLSNSRKKISQRAVVKKKGVWWKQFWLLLKRAQMQVCLFLICVCLLIGWKDLDKLHDKTDIKFSFLKKFEVSQDYEISASLWARYNHKSDTIYCFNILYVVNLNYLFSPNYRLIFYSDH